MIRGILLDLDGTLVESERIWQRAWLDVKRSYQLTVPDREFWRLSGVSPEENERILKEILPSWLDLEKVQQQRKAYFDHVLASEGVAAKKGAKRFLAACRKRALPYMVVTNTGRKRAEDRMRLAGILEDIPCMLCGDDVPCRKPDPRGYQMGCQKLHLRPEECLVIEDSKVGLQAAKRAGMTAVLMEDVALLTEQDRAMAIHSCHDFDELWEWIEKENVL